MLGLPIAATSLLRISIRKKKLKERKRRNSKIFKSLKKLKSQDSLI